MQLQPEVSSPRVRRWRLAVLALVVIVVATAFGLVVLAWRSAESRAELAATRAREERIAALLAERAELLRRLDGCCDPPPPPQIERERAQLEAAKRRLQCAQRKAKLEAALAKDDPVAWVLDDVGGDIRAYRGECDPDDARVEELARRFEAATHETGRF